MRGRSVVVGFALLLGVCLIVAVVLAIVARAPEPPPDCLPGTECGGPPGAGTDATPAPPGSNSGVPGSPVPVPPGTIGIRAGTPWISQQLGYQFEYSDWWALDPSNEDPREADFDYQGTSGDGVLIVAAVPRSEADPQAYEDRWLARLKEFAPDLKADASEKNAILGPEIGFVDGIGATYAGSWTSPQSATTPVGIGMVVASDGKTTAAVVVIVWNPDRSVASKWLQYNIRSRAELTLKTFRWGPS